MPPISRQKIAVFSCFYMLILVFGLELASRAYWSATKKLSFFAPEAMELFYPWIRETRGTPITKGDGYFDILFLGGSVLYDVGDWEKAVPLLQERLGDKIKSKIRIHNLARPSHSSLDSLFKYRSLSDKHFDLVVIYESINEVRANNCPPEIFRDDYSHYSWYHKLNFFERHGAFKFFTLPYTLYSLSADIRQKLKPAQFVPTDIPNEDWGKYGKTIRTAKPFQRNLESIINLAKRRQEPVLLMTFTFYVPKDYSYGKFKLRRLDYTYGEHSFPIEVWGKPEHVIRGALVHNTVIKNLAAQHREIMLLDELSLMPQNGAFFQDICHLTDQGIEKFLNDVAETLKNNPALLQINPRHFPFF